MNLNMLFEIIGWAGSAMVVIAYFLVTTHKLSPSSKVFQLLNLVGAAAIMGNSAIHNALPSVGINVVWIFIAIYGLAKSIKK